MKKLVYLIACFGCLFLAACTSDELEYEGVDDARKVVQVASRANGVDFVPGDEMGVYISNFVDNMKFIYKQSAWTPERELVWEHDPKEAVFVAYFPYQEIKDAQEVRVQVNSDQSTIGNYRASDFLAGSMLVTDPLGKVVTIKMAHTLSQLDIKVVPGKGFSEEELQKADIQVNICKIHPSMYMNLWTMSSQLNTRTITNVKALKKSHSEFAALIPPQTVGEYPLIEVVVDGISYFLKKSMSFSANKLYHFTVDMKKTQGGLDVGIEGWEDDGEDYGGEVN